MRDKETVTCETLKNKLFGKGELNRTLIPIFQDHNDRMEKLIGKEFAKETLTRYKTCISHTKEFLKWKYNLIDIHFVNKLRHLFSDW